VRYGGSTHRFAVVIAVIDVWHISRHWPEEESRGGYGTGEDSLHNLMSGHLMSGCQICA
jgi:hypothetical protein